MPKRLPFYRTWVLAFLSGFSVACISSDVVEPGRRFSHPPLLDLVPADGYTRGALITQTSVSFPDTAASGSIDLIGYPGASGPVLIEVVGTINLTNGTVPLTELLDPGSIMYYRPNGDFYVRSMGFHFRKVSSGGSATYMPPPVLTASDSILLVDDSAGVHGLRLLWDAGPETFTGYNVADPNFPWSCGLMISFLCYPAPGFDSLRVSGAPPSGTIQVRVYAIAPDTLSLVCTPNPVTRGVETTCHASAPPGGTINGWGYLGPWQAGLGDSLRIVRNSSDTVWSGTAVLSGQVSVIGTIHGVPDTARATLVVNRRTGSSWRWDQGDKWSYQQDGLPVKCIWGDYKIGVPAGLGRNRRLSTCSTNPDQVVRIEPSVVAAPDSGFTADSVRSGPNTGLWYVTAVHYRMDRASEMNPFIRPNGHVDTLPLTLPSGATHPDTKICWSNVPAFRFNRVIVNFYTYNQSCRLFSLTDFYAKLWAHEGFGTLNPLDSLVANGHEARARIAARDSVNDPYRIAEPMWDFTRSALRQNLKVLVDGADRRILVMADADTLHTFVRNNYVVQGQCGKAWVFRPHIHPDTNRYWNIQVIQQNGSCP